MPELIKTETVSTNGGEGKTFLSQRGALWFFCFLLLVFLLCRAHYFFPSVPIYNLLTFDSSWWLNLQVGLQHPEIFGDDEYFQARLDIRTSVSTLPQRGLVALSNFLGISLLTLNLLISSVIYFLTLLALNFLGLTVLKDPKWTIFFVLLVSQCTYFRWLRYPVLVPKMLGFLMYPLVLAALIRAPHGRFGYAVFVGTFLIAVILYPGSVMYYFPALAVAGFVSIFVCREEGELGWQSLKKYTIGILTVSILSIIVWTSTALKSFSEPMSPVPLHITEYFYTNHKFGFPRGFFVYLIDYGDYFIFCIVALIFLFRRAGHWCLHTTLLFSVFVGCIGFAIATHIAASSVPEIRMLWLWRAAYYSYVPGLLLIVLGLMEMARHGNLSNRMPYTFAKKLAIVLLIWIIIRTPIVTNSLKGTLVSLYKLTTISTDINAGEKQKTDLFSFAAATPSESIFLLPTRRYWKWHLYTFEVRTVRRTAMSRMNMGLMVVSHRLTGPYFRLLKEYDEIESIEDEREFQHEMIKFAKKMKATHIIYPNNQKFQLNLPLAYQDASWLVYQTTT